MQRYFTLAEAEALIPQLTNSLRQAQDAQNDAKGAEEQILQQKYKVAMSGGSVVNINRSFALRDQRQHALERLKSIAENLILLGCQLKDLEKGLIDFPTFYEGNEVLLCWRLGEESIDYWHSTEEGFAGRKEIDDHFRAHHRKEPLI